MSDSSNNQNDDLYRDTVFLPQTEFPMRGNLPQKEPGILQNWQDIKLEEKLREAGKTRTKKILHDGPPYANGNIHMGHALNKILKDVVVRAWSMAGYNAPYVPGWDCHGLPIEWKVEEQYRDKGLDKDEVDILQFRQECRDFAQKWVDIQSGQFRRLGVGGTWDKPYLTMAYDAEAAIVREIHKFVANGMLYQGAKPVMWSVVEKTALAEAEVEYKEHKSVTIWVRFPVVETKVDALKGTDIVIWTTTPWTMPSNRGIAYGEDIDYGVFEVKKTGEGARSEAGAKIAVALALAEDVREAAKIEEWEQVATLSGRDLAGTICQHPLNGQGYDHQVPLMPADFVTDDAGTGFVHIAPGHGEDDFILGQKHGLELTFNVSDDGKYNDHVPLFAGLEVYDQDGNLGQGNFAILKAIDETGKLLAKGSLRHEYPHSWRSKAPLIFRATPQWFVAMDGEGGLRKTALKAIDETRWIPGKGEARIRSMIEGRPDWCISRQRAWGVPIAIFVHKETGEILRDEGVLSCIADIFEKEGADAWWARPAEDFLGGDYNAEDYDQVFDIVDVWFESGSTHAYVVEAREELGQRSDLYLEGSDQHRGWFQSSLLESCGTRGRAPFETVLTHGFVLDGQGYKMSKSMGNVVDPLKLMDQYGADILRLWALTSDYAEDIRIGENSMKNTGDLYRRIRNSLRFLLGALDGYSKDEAVSLDDLSKLPELEQLMLHQLYEMDQKIRGYIADYNFIRMVKDIHEFCNNNLSAFYFDIRKDRLYCDDPNGFERRAARTVMAHIFDCLSTWLAPVLAFTAEEAWSHRPPGVFGDEDSIHLRTFPDIPDHWQNSALAGKWFGVRDIRKKVLEAIEPLRAEKTLRSSLEAAPVVYLSEDAMGAIEGLDMAEICITGPVTVKEREDDTQQIDAEIRQASGQKCERCWRVRDDVGDDNKLCSRCDEVVEKVKKAA